MASRNSLSPFARHIIGVYENNNNPFIDEVVSPVPVNNFANINLVNNINPNLQNNIITGDNIHEIAFNIFSSAFEFACSSDTSDIIDIDQALDFAAGVTEAITGSIDLTASIYQEFADFSNLGVSSEGQNFYSGLDS